MKTSTLFITFVMAICFVAAEAQTDSIFTRSETILCNVKEVGEQTVTYVFPGEEVINHAYKNAIAKIVFKNGRVQTFDEFKALKPVLHAGDFDKVQILETESEQKGLTKLASVNSKAKGATTLSSALNVQDRALRKLLIETAMIGGNALVMSRVNTTPSRSGSDYVPGQTAYSLQSGMAFTSVVLNENDFRKLVGSKTTFEVKRRYWMGKNSFDLSQSPASGIFTMNVIEPVKDNKLWVRGSFSKFRTASGEGIILDGIQMFRVVAYNETQFTLYFQSESGIGHNIVLNFKE